MRWPSEILEPEEHPMEIQRRISIDGPFNDAASGTEDSETSGRGYSSSPCDRHSTGQTGNSTDDKVYFATDISRRVASLKLLTFLVLFCVAVAVCLAVYFVTDRGQEDEFEVA